jgi:F-type H+-transporting ATPase subunit epsilon
MSTFQLSLVSPERRLFEGQADQVDVPGVEGDFGVLAGHAPIIAMLRPGIVTTIAGTSREKFVVFGGIAEFSKETLTILAESATSVDDFDLVALNAQIEEMKGNLPKEPIGDELDRAIELLDHYKSIQISLAPATAF